MVNAEPAGLITSVNSFDVTPVPVSVAVTFTEKLPVDEVVPLIAPVAMMPNPEGSPVALKL
jgi:hypothetical protein